MSKSNAESTLRHINAATVDAGNDKTAELKRIRRHEGGPAQHGKVKLLVVSK